MVPVYRSPFSAAAPPRQARTGPAPDRTASARQVGCVRRRAWLLGGSLLLLAAPLTLSAPAAHWAGDPELFRLLRGMAAIKGLLAVLAFAAVWWRLGRDATPRLAATYVGAVWVLALAAGLIWQLTAVAAASGLFHCATILLLVAAWRDAGPVFERRRHVVDGTDRSG